MRPPTSSPQLLNIPQFEGRALCAQTDPEAFFPAKGGSSAAAKRVCNGCDIQAACLAWAIATGERHGIWGGRSEAERRRMRRQTSTPSADHPQYSAHAPAAATTAA